MFKHKDKKEQRQKRHLRVRAKLSGTAERPRLAVYRSEKHIYAQLIDDIKGITLVSASTVDREMRDSTEKPWNVEAASQVGKLLAKKALEKGISSVVFDRGGFNFHGRVKSLADGAREGGLKF
ncbi:MAG TPA: 50S ribosomal protein L18 [Mesotoga sp.]|jgi:large subunit ribosomal protein L18|nr:50S ribosomal protein L18 [Mesotoga sp.]MDI9374413.1 50S ribosomal protein L18 [Thermotogota bacterium]NLX33640.1 50S ribosomal protein L18 [Thermotogaceae bacterium]MDD4040466.1 50S ribosomal protein L18 [Mesotoga sp.]MDD4477560.1 50S ribosomal protein L18 [Mesotoga sp.]